MSNSERCRPFAIGFLVVLSTLVIAGIAVASLDQSVDFRPYFAGLPAPAAVMFVCVVGITMLYLLQEYWGFCVRCSSVGWRDWATAVGLAFPFMATVTLLDLALKLPEDINVELPTAFVFYPAMGFVAQISLHIVPFAVCLWVLTRLFGTPPSDRRIWCCMALAALPEAAFQFSGSSIQGDAEMLGALVAAQLFAFGLVELYLFRRFDFVCMYLFRITYYGYWHILWGNLRV